MNESKITLDASLINKTLNNGGVIAFVTDTVWGLGCLPNNKVAVEKIYEIKGRDKSKPLILMSNKEEYLFPYVKEIPQKAKDLMNIYFPGALTLVLEKSEQTPYTITSNKETVGIRVPNNELFNKLCSIVDGHVLATTSANLSNEPSSKTFEETHNSVGHLVDIVLNDFGYSCKGEESTVALILQDEIKVLREGNIKITHC